MKRALTVLLALLLTTAAVAQSVPNGGAITQGQVWTTPQWNNAWQSKADTTNAFSIGNQSPVAGGAMQVDRILEGGSPLFPLANEGGIWPSTAYVYTGVSQTVNAATVPGQGSSGPLTGFFSFLNNNGAIAPAVANLSDCVVRTASGICFGANFIARNAAVNGAKLVGEEIDVEPSAGTTIASSSAGLIFNMFNIASSAPVILIGGLGGGTWGNGVQSSHITGAHYAVLSGDPTTATSFINTVNAQPFSAAAIVLGQGAAQAVDFGGGIFGTSPYVYGDSSGNLIASMGTAGAVILQKPSGANEWIFDQFGNFSATGAIAVKTNGSTALTISTTQVVTATEPVQLASFTVAGLPACGVVIVNSMAAVTDQNGAPSYRGSITGGGALRVPVFCGYNGTTYAWEAH